MPGDHHPKYKSCVDKVKAKGGDVNAYAVCHASTGESVEELIKEQILETQIKDCSGVSCGCQKKKPS